MAITPRSMRVRYLIHFSSFMAYTPFPPGERVGRNRFIAPMPPAVWKATRDGWRNKAIAPYEPLIAETTSVVRTACHNASCVLARNPGSLVPHGGKSRIVGTRHLIPYRATPRPC
jgi:hypothetical protein